MAKERPVDIRRNPRTISDLPPMLPGELTWAGDVVRFLTATPTGPVRALPLQCDRKASYGICRGWLWGQRSEIPAVIEWECPACELAGRIVNWEGTPYDLRGLIASPPAPSEEYQFVLDVGNFENLIWYWFEPPIARLLASAEVRAGRIRLRGTAAEFQALRDVLLPSPSRPGKKLSDPWAGMRARVEALLAAPPPAPAPGPTREELLAEAKRIVDGDVHLRRFLAQLAPGARAEYIERLITGSRLTVALPLAREFGMPAEQICDLIAHPPPEAFVRPEAIIGSDELGAVPLVADVLLCLREIEIRPPLKATVTGNLPREFCRVLRDLLVSDPDYLSGDMRYRRIKVQGEDDCTIVAWLRYLLQGAGWLRLQKGKFQITKTGAAVLRQTPDLEFYRKVLATVVRRVNWGANDRYPDYNSIQLSFGYTLFLLNRWGAERRPAADYALAVARAYPALEREHGLNDAHHSEFNAEISTIYILRMFEWVLLPLGLIELHGKRSYSGVDQRQVRRTTLYDRLIRIPTREECAEVMV